MFDLLQFCLNCCNNIHTFLYFDRKILTMQIKKIKLKDSLTELVLFIFYKLTKTYVITIFVTMHCNYLVTVYIFYLLCRIIRVLALMC